jgi:hypothetical protein
VDGDVQDYTLGQLKQVLVPAAGAVAAAMGGDSSDSSDSGSDDSEAGSSSSARLASQARKAFRVAPRTVSAMSPDALARTEMETYRGVCTDVSMRPLESPLTFWSGYEFQMPRHYRLARRVFAILATEGNAERFFSKAGAVLTGKRMQLDPEVASASSIFGLECNMFAISERQFNAVLDE